MSGKAEREHVTTSPHHEGMAEWPRPESADADADLPVKLGETLAERYVLEGILGTGGMGIVCRARHVELEQPVAVKFLRKRFAGERNVVARFLEEARAAAALRSVHAVRVMDVGQTPSGIPYYVMEHLEGTDLESLLVREGPLRIPRALDYIRQACAGLREAHALGIVHRDVKPENLFLSTRGSETPVLKVVDFGIAKRLDPARAKVVTGPQENLGSPCYMSPEQMWTPRSVDTRTDVWSLGVVLYQLLTGALPFDGDSVSDVFARVASAEFAPMSALRPDVDAHLDAIVRRCLEKSLDARYPSVDALADDIERYEAAVLAGTDPSLAFEPPPPRMRSDAPVSAEIHPKARRRAQTPRHTKAWTLMALSSLAALAALTLTSVVSVRPGGGATLDRVLSGGRSAILRIAEGRVIPARLSTDTGPAQDRAADRAVTYVVEPFGVVVADATDATELRAEREHDAPDVAPARPEPSATERGLTETERRERAYQRYLKRHGWRPLKDVLQEMSQPE